MVNRLLTARRRGGERSSLEASHIFHFFFLVSWTGLWAVTFWTLLVGAEHLGSGDFGEQFHAFAHFQAREWSAGRIPLWSDGSYGGFPFVADPQSGSFYLPRLLTLLLSPAETLSYYALTLEALLHVWLAGALTYLFALRETGSRAGAGLAAVGFGLGGYLLGYPLQQLAILESITWLPLALFCLSALADASGRFARQRWAAAVAAVLALTVTAGHPQTFLHVAYLCIPYYLWRTAGNGWLWRSRLGYGALLAAIALALSAPAWLPAARYTLNTSRASVTYAFTAAGLPLIDFFQAVLPGAFSLFVPQYVGMAVLLLAAAALFRFKSGGARFWGAVVLISGWLALGDRGILFEAAYHALPGAALFRQQERWLSLFSFALVLLAAHGAAELPRMKKRTVLQAAGVVAGLFGVGAFILAVGPALRPQGWTSTIIRQLLLGGAALLLIWLARRRPVAWPLLLGLLAADLYLATAPGIGRQPGSPTEFWLEPAWIAALRESESRLDTQNAFWSNFGERYGVTDVAGISPLKPEGLSDLEELPRDRRWSLLGVTHVVDQALPEGVAGVTVQPVDNVKSDVPGPSGLLFALSDPTPPIRVLYQTVVEPDRERALALLGSETFDPRRHVILPEAVDLPETTPEEEAAVEVLARRPGRWELRVDSPAAGILVVSQWHYPGWQARIDGEATELLAANHVLQGVRIPAGQSTLSFTYRPPELFAGAALALLAALASVVLLAVPLPRRGPVPVPGMGLAAPRQYQRPLPAFPSWRHVRAALGTVDVRLYLVLILLLAGFLRLQTAAGQDLRGDEAFTVAVTDEPASRIVETLIRTNDPHPPLHYFVMNGWRALAGASELALRLSSIWLSLLLIALTARLGFDLGGRSLGMVAALLMALSQSQIWMAQDVRNQYLLALCFGIVATLLLWRRRGWWAYGVAAALTVYSHYFGIFLLLSHAVLLLASPRRRADLGRWILAGLGAALLFLPWLILMFRSTVATQLSEPMLVDLGEHVLRVGSELAAGNGLGERGRRWIFLAALLAALWGARQGPRPGRTGRSGAGVWLLSWVGLVVLGLFAVRLNRTIYNDFYAVMAAPAWWLLIGAGALDLLRRGGSGLATGRWRTLLPPLQAAGGVALLLLLLGANAASARAYFGDTVTYGRDRGYRDVAATLESQAAPDDLLLFHAPDPSLGYYVRDLPPDQALVPPEIGMDEEAINRATEETVAGYPRIWFVPADGGVRDPDNAVTRWLDYHLLHEQYRQFDGLALRAYRPVESVLEVALPLDARWAGALDLQAVYLTRNGLPVPLERPLRLQSGDELAVTLLWRAGAAVEDEYVVFVHLLDETGRLLGQHDGIPLFGTRPTPTWVPGERLLDRHVLNVDAVEGEMGARLVVGLYEPVSLERVAAETGETAVIIFPAGVVVEPAGP